MHQILIKIIPNIMDKLPTFYEAILDTIIMVVWSGLISFIIGLFLGIVLTVTKPNGIFQHRIIYQVLEKTTNFFRSIPFIILLSGVMPLSRLLTGTAIGVKGAIVPLVFGTVPFFSRQVESALAELDNGLIEAATAMGSSPLEIIYRVYLKESIPGLARATTITTISLIGITAMAGVVGAGGLGDFAIRYGKDRNQPDVTYVTIIVLAIMVGIIQMIGNKIIKKTTH